MAAPSVQKTWDRSAPARDAAGVGLPAAGGPARTWVGLTNHQGAVRCKKGGTRVLAAAADHGDLAVLALVVAAGEGRDLFFAGNMETFWGISHLKSQAVYIVCSCKPRSGPVGTKVRQEVEARIRGLFSPGTYQGLQLGHSDLLETIH